MSNVTSICYFYSINIKVKPIRTPFPIKNPVKQLTNNREIEEGKRKITPLNNIFTHLIISIIIIFQVDAEPTSNSL